jgi:8-oxo-dGTP diphosphatase
MRKVTAAIIERGGRILIAKRKRGDRFEGLWEFPGGKLEPRESPEEGLRRELFEELGIEAKIGKFICSVPYFSSFLSIELLVYEVAYVSGEFRLHDHDEVRWVLPGELDKFKFTEPDIPVVNKIKK